LLNPSNNSLTLEDVAVNGHSSTGQRARFSYFGIGFAVLVAVVFLGPVIVLVTGDSTSMLMALAVCLVYGLLHYLLWGQTFLTQVSREREVAVHEASQHWDAMQPSSDVTLSLTESERLELTRVLQEALATHQTGASPNADSKAMKDVLEKLDDLES
jgi:hypothetical protein